MNIPRLPYEFPEALRTPRLLLRPMTERDVDDVHAYQSLPEVCRYLLFEPRSREEVEQKLMLYAQSRVLTGDGDFWQVAVERLDTPGQVIGDVFFAIRDTGNATGEIGWTLHPDHTGAGYMTEAATALLRIAFETLGLHRVTANLDPRNHSSAALCRRLGLRAEAQFVEDLWSKGEWTDSAIYAILDREWVTRREQV